MISAHYSKFIFYNLSVSCRLTLKVQFTSVGFHRSCSSLWLLQNTSIVKLLPVETLSVSPWKLTHLNFANNFLSDNLNFLSHNFTFFFHHFNLFYNFDFISHNFDFLSHIFNFFLIILTFCFINLTCFIILFFVSYLKFLLSWLFVSQFWISI